MVITVKSKSKHEDNPQPKPISKLLKGLLFFILFFFGMDFGLIKYKSRRQKITVKMSINSNRFCDLFLHNDLLFGDATRIYSFQFEMCF